jgi:hypothetical protein
MGEQAAEDDHPERQAAGTGRQKPLPSNERDSLGDLREPITHLLPFLQINATWCGFSLLATLSNSSADLPTCTASGLRDQVRRFCSHPNPIAFQPFALVFVFSPNLRSIIERVV